MLLVTDHFHSLISMSRVTRQNGYYSCPAGQVLWFPIDESLSFTIEVFNLSCDIIPRMYVMAGSVSAHEYHGTR